MCIRSVQVIRALKNATPQPYQGFSKTRRPQFINNNIQAGPQLHLGPSGKARQLGLRRSVGKPHYSNHQTRPTPNLSAAKTRHSKMLDFKREQKYIHWDHQYCAWVWKHILQMYQSRLKYFQYSGKIWQRFSLMVNQREVEVVFSPLQSINNQPNERNRKYTFPDSSSDL